MRTSEGPGGAARHNATRILQAATSRPAIERTLPNGTGRGTVVLSPSGAPVNGLPNNASRRRVLSPLCVAVAAVATFLPACAGSGQYLQDRGADLAEVVQVHLVGSVGANAKVEVTRFVGVGGGAYRGYAVGLANGRWGAWREQVVDLGIIWPDVVWMNVHAEQANGAPGDCVSGSYYVLLSQSANGYEHDSESPYDWATVRLTAVLFAGVDCELRLHQVIDFVGGLFGTDPLSDDRAVAAAVSAVPAPGIAL
jgi:hypothetical protein